MNDLSRRDAIKLAFGAGVGLVGASFASRHWPSLLFGNHVAFAASAPTITITKNYTDIVDCTYFEVSSTDRNSSQYAFCADHDSSPYIEGQTFSNGVRPSQGGFSVAQERMYDYLLYYGYGGKEVRYNDYTATQRVAWMIAHGRNYRYPRDEGSVAYALYDAAKAYADAGGGGKPAGCSYFYANSGGYQPVVHGVFGSYGSVSVTKERDGGHDDTFDFRITVRDGSSVVLDTPFSLKGGETRKFDNLPEGATYEVTETGGAEHYETEWTNRTGRVGGDGSIARVVCKNVSHGWLVIDKQLDI